MLVDRCRAFSSWSRSSEFFSSRAKQDEKDDIEWRVADRWKFDLDEEPAFGPEEPDEQHRALTEDIDLKYDLLGLSRPAL